MNQIIEQIADLVQFINEVSQLSNYLNYLFN